MEFATGALGTLLPKLGQLLNYEYKLQKGVRKNIQFLERELRSMHAALVIVGGVPPEQLTELVRIWAKDVRELSYDMEDIVDAFLVRVEGPDRLSRKGAKKFIKKMFDIVTKGTTRHQIAEEIKDIKERVKEVAERRDRYKVDAISPAKTTVDPRIAALYTKATDLVGIDEAKEEVIMRLIKGEDMSTQQQRIVSIVGFGGLGKTTLARAVHDKIKGHFDCSAFVSVSQSLNMKKFFMDILYALDNASYGDIHNTKRDETQLIDLVREFLKNKRYLIIVDDIWNISHWKNIKCAFPDDNDGCGIITTTRNETVAKHIGGFYKMKHLSLDNSRILLYGRVFGNQDNGRYPDEQLAEISDRILKKCDGVPLAIITIASMLAGKKRDKMVWEDVCNSIGTGRENSSLDVGDMRKILSLSYYDMPSHLRTCLLYLSVFPEDYEIDKDRLIWKWIAESFIKCEEEGVTQYEVAESWLNELVNRSMVQPIYVHADSAMIAACRVHDMVLDLICSISSEENFATISNSVHRTSTAEKIRRLSLQNGETDHNISWVSTSMQQVRSVVAFGTSIQLMPTLESFRVLRVLDLEGCDLSQGYSLKYLGNLLHLRYLELQRTKIDQLPEEIGNLRFLQTLDVEYNRIDSLPTTITQLNKLRRLRISEFVTVPNGIGALMSLEELSCVSIDRESRSCIIEELSGLTELKVLNINFYIEIDGDDSRNKSLVEWLNKLEKIRSLCLRFYRDGWNLDGWVYEGPLHLRSLVLYGHVLSALPAWLNPSQVPCLSYLWICVREVQQEGLEILGSLPALRCLMLYLEVPGRFVVGAGSFSCLVRCYLWGGGGHVVLFQQGAMLKLTSLELKIHVRETREINGGFDLGLGNLPSLQHVKVGFDPEGAGEEEVQEAKAAVRHAIEIHPNHPTLTNPLGGRMKGSTKMKVLLALTLLSLLFVIAPLHSPLLLGLTPPVSFADLVAELGSDEDEGIIDRRRDLKLKLIATFAETKCSLVDSTCHTDPASG
ncbi:hypothetical protein ACP70R_008154 [Stipagrostis hirtigluma subsp. patula]